MCCSIQSTIQPMARPMPMPAEDQVPHPHNAAAHRWRLAAQQNREPKFQRQQSARVIHQALAFQDVNDPFGQADLVSNRSGGNRVGWSDHRAQNQSDSPVESREQIFRCYGYADHREKHQANRQAPGC